MKKTYFKINIDKVLESDLLKTSTQKIVLLKLLNDYQNSSNTKFATLSTDISESLNISVPTFRKESKVLEENDFFQVKVKQGSYKWIAVDSNNRKHKYLYYFMNFKLLDDFSIIKIKKKQVT